MQKILDFIFHPAIISPLPTQTGDLMKAVKFYVGKSSPYSNKIPLVNGKGKRMIHAAQSESGAWFIRVEDISGYRPVWSKWEKLDQSAIQFTDEIYNDYKREIVKLKSPGIWIGGYPDQPIETKLICTDETGKRAVRLPS